MTDKTYAIPAAKCGHCKVTIETKVGELAGVTSVRVNVDTKQAIVTYASPTTASEIQ